MKGVYINGRFSLQQMSGVQRYGRGVLAHLPAEGYTQLTPKGNGRLAGIAWEQFTLPRQLKAQESPLLLNFCNTAPVTYPNQIVTIHDLAAMEHPEWFSPAFGRYYQWLMPRIASKAMHVVTVSEWSKQKLIERFRISDQKITVIPAAIEETLVQAKAEPVPGLSKGFLLMVGSADPRKQFALAARTLLPEVKKLGLQIVIAGGTETNFTSEPFPADEHIVLVKAPSDGQLAWLYRNAELVVHPSLYEGFSLVPHEALAFGTRIVVSDIPVHRDMLGENAIYLDPKEMIALPEAIKHSLSLAKPLAPDPASLGYASSAASWVSLVRSVQ